MSSDLPNPDASLSMDASVEQIAAFMRSCSFEATRPSPSDIAGLARALPAGAPVYLTAIPGKPLEELVDAALSLMWAEGADVALVHAGADDAVDPDDVGMLEDLVLAALNDAVAQIDELQRSSMPSIMRSITSRVFFTTPTAMPKAMPQPRNRPNRKSFTRSVSATMSSRSWGVAQPKAVMCSSVTIGSLSSSFL